MANLKVTSEAYIKYSMTTWQGEVEIDGEEICYRYSEDDNGAELYILDEDQGWLEADLDEEDGNEKHRLLWGAIMMWGTPEDFGTTGAICDIDEEELEDYL